MRRSVLAAFIFLVFNSAVLAETKFDYPELVVTPSASDRVTMLAKDHQGQNFFAPMALQIAAATTLFSGIMHAGQIDVGQDPDELSHIPAIALGASLLAFNYLSFNQNNYFLEAHNKLKKMPSKSKSEELARERIAEEMLKSRARYINRITWISTVANLGVNTYMLSNVNKETFAEVSHMIAIATSFLPIIFESDVEEAWENHKSYKKKVYGPVVKSDLLYHESSKTFVPGMRLSYSF